MRIILDENLPQQLKRIFTGHSVNSVQELGLATVKNGRLLALLENKCDVFVTADKNIRYQQNLSARRIAIVVLGNQQWPNVKLHLDRIVEAVNAAIPGSYAEVEIPRKD